MQHCLFWVHATVSFFSSLADVAGTTVLHSWERRRKGVEVEEEWEVKSEKRTSWECVHHGTTHKAHRCKRRHPSQDQVFDCLIVVRKKRVTVLWALVSWYCRSHREFTQSLFPLSCLVVGSPHPSICKQESHQRFEEFTLRWYLRFF